MELSLTTDMAEKAKLSLNKTLNIEPDILHWYGKILVFNRKRYAFCVNTKTRFAVFFRFNSKSLAEDFKAAIEKQFSYYGLNFDSLKDEDVILSLSNSRSLTSQLNTAAQDAEYVLHRHADSEEEFEEILMPYNKHNLGKAGDSKDMVFALDEMKKYY